VSVSGGPFVTAEVLGEPGARRLHVRVLAPAWIGVARIDVIAAPGEVHTSVPVPQTTDVVRFDGDVALPGLDDTWVLVWVEGAGDLAPIDRGERPFAFTNPLVVGTLPAR
jgi:hypothetical protein